MSWDKTGKIQSGEYMGSYYVGRIVSSRVKYGGTVQHIVELFEPIKVFSELRKTILVADPYMRAA